MTDLPYPIDEGSTHWDGCYRERRHHNCAVVEVDRLRAENEQLLEEAFDMGVDMTAMRDENKRLRAALASVLRATSAALQRRASAEAMIPRIAHIACEALEAPDA